MRVVKGGKSGGESNEGGFSSPGLREKVLVLLGTGPFDEESIFHRLGLPPVERARLRKLLDQLETRGEVARIRKNRYILPREADLFTGVIQFHPTGSAYVLSEAPGEPDLLISSENTWTAMHGDRVVARVSSDLKHPKHAGRVRREGRVIRILKRANESLVGTLQRSRNFFYVVADDPRFVHNLYVPPPEASLGARPGDKVVAQLDDWLSRHVNPEGRIIELLGRAGAPGVDMLSIIRKHRLPIRFPDDVIEEANAISPDVDAAEAGKREDLRGRFIITIDPDDARDFDDAIEVQRTPRGWSLGIHIADVSHYVRPRSALDREALSRGNSVYLADRVIPMLPEALSNGICSLKPAVDRMAFSVFAAVNQQGKVHNVRFARTVIRSAARLTYKQALRILDSPPEDELGRRVHEAWELSALLRRSRFAAGSLDLDFPELKVWLDDEGRPIRLEKIENDISHQLIEELMLLANEVVARALRRFRQPVIYRVHEDPDPQRLLEYREIAAAHGVKVGDLTNRAELQRLLEITRGEPYEYAIKLGLLKSLKRARYAPDPLGHYGLAKSDYTHFTSPIRRYADLVAHRALAKQIGAAKTGPSSSQLAAASEHISNTERIAAEAEKESIRLKKLEYFETRIGQRKGETFDAIIIEVRNYGLFVELPDFLLSGLVHVSSFDDDFYVFDPVRARMVGRKTRKTFQAGQKTKVVVARVDSFKQQVDFKLAL